MSYLASPLALGNIPPGDYLSVMPGMDLPDQQSTLESETFVSDEMSFPLKRFSYDDASFSDMVPPFEPAAPSTAAAGGGADTGDSSTASIDHNHKLLSFSLPAYNFSLLDYSLRRTSLSLAAQLHGMFFLAESPWTNAPADHAPPQQGAELTCYRRNLFQITGSVTLPRSLRYIMTDQGDRIPILAQELTVSATESVEGNPVKIISVPWKTPNGANGNGGGGVGGVVAADEPPTTSNNPKSEKEPPPIPLDIMAGQDLDADYATFPIAWKRLQFRVATANNGRRKELQQHFVVRLKVLATLSTGAKIPICEVQSGPVIVRGRSPRNFQSRKDLPLSGSAAASRKNAAALNSRASATPAKASNKQAAPPPPPPPPPATAKSSSSPETTHSLPHVSHPSPDWSQVPPHSAASASTSALAHPSLYPHSSPESIHIHPVNPNDPSHSHSHPVGLPPGATRPINLSLLDDDEVLHSAETVMHDLPRASISASDSSQQQHQHQHPQQHPQQPPAKIRKTSHQASTSSLVFNTSLLQDHHHHHQQPSLPPFASSSSLSTLPFPSESTDFLYEYFPLGLDDWQSPVDAVYRPHVVHHTTLPEMKYVAARGRNKRYFAAEDVF
ncbi:hypothetical protein ASPZODRAFT_133339 [Penicilliopsis zonata CBS 506.65]|uniref:NDT80 domain-containing protein n=1 Tax=Penicilliopsis zonata CBS 506.65 TaxID=1073090 RepID=A0A1L9SGE8_9EURO|nr:hypothetical protein ASPZODRAFT_133339 [Penicilliopsis zonata CBS 506.65]OJJ46310.1 hypothetical protein ASPZODRAFT_133339 [Penicilliopsis zonata CBS 506.65]